jgi:demethoxyubiquinone hydroxylase (CLK1/Coq7/Cat5 family)
MRRDGSGPPSLDGISRVARALLWNLHRQRSGRKRKVTIMQTNPHHQSRANDADVEELQKLLRAEMAAVETYALAQKSIDHVGQHDTLQDVGRRGALQEILTSHSHRVEQIRTQVEGLGTEPAKSSCVWGAFAEVFHAGADVLGDRAAIDALEQIEDRLLVLYDEDALSVDAHTQRLIQDQLLPSQRYTHELCRMLKPHPKSPS